MMCDDNDVKQSVADNARAMMGELDWRLTAEAGVWEGLEPAYWWGVGAKVFPL